MTKRFRNKLRESDDEVDNGLADALNERILNAEMMMRLTNTEDPNDA